MAFLPQLIYIIPGALGLVGIVYTINWILERRGRKKDDKADKNRRDV